MGVVLGGLNPDLDERGSCECFALLGAGIHTEEMTRSV